MDMDVPMVRLDAVFPMEAEECPAILRNATFTGEINSKLLKQFDDIDVTQPITGDDPAF
jgi:hypothetical protein